MCVFCDSLRDKNKRYPRTLAIKQLNMGILGEGGLYLSMECDLETEEFCLIADFDPPRSDDFYTAACRIHYCPFCGKRLEEE